MAAAPPQHQQISGTLATNGSQAIAGNVYGNVHYGHTYITNVRPLARELHRSLLLTSSHQFKPVQDDLSHLITILETIAEDSDGAQIDCGKEPAFRKLVQDSQDILGQLHDFKEHYDSVGTRTQKTWEREQWRAEDLTEIRSSLMSTTSALNTAYIRLIHSSTNTIMSKLDRFISEVQSGKREGSMVITGSLSADEAEAWRQIRRELETVGITPALFSQHHDAIIARLQDAFSSGDLITFGEEPAGRELHDAENSKPRYLEAQGRTIAQNNNQTSTTKSFTLPPSSNLRGPGRVASLLSKMTGGGRRLREAAARGDESSVRKLIKKGADINLFDPYNGSALTQASKNGHEAVVTALLETGNVDVTVKEEYNKTALFLAAAEGHETVVWRLLETGQFDVNEKDTVFKRTALSRAAESGYASIVMLLLEEGRANTDLIDAYERTALSWAAKGGQEAIVNLLLDAKADINWGDSRGSTPLILAASRGHKHVVELLLRRGANRTLPDNKGLTASAWALRNGHRDLATIISSQERSALNHIDI